MRRLLSTALSLAVLAGCGGGAAKSEIREVWDTYRTALLDQHGEVAVDLVSEPTIRAYDRFRLMAWASPEETLRRSDFLTRMTVLMLRLRVPREILKDLDGRELFVLCVDNGWLSDSVPLVGAGAVKLQGERRALLQLQLEGDEGPAGALPFVLEGPSWKVDLEGMTEFINEGFREGVARSGRSEAELLEQFVAMMAGQEFPQELWTPVSEWQ
jgi:hypothetical protein